MMPLQRCKQAINFGPIFPPPLRSSPFNFLTFFVLDFSFVQYNTQNTNALAFSGIRTRNPSMLMATGLRIRSLGQRVRQLHVGCLKNSVFAKLHTI